MGLSKELIQQFVKATNDIDGRNAETFVLGTVVTSNGKDYVKIDGSETLTPVHSTTALNEGDRVTVMIKNHTATVTGNITSPSIDKSGVKNEIDEFGTIIAQDIEAQNAKIDNLVAENVEIKGSITATEGKIENLEANNLVVNDKLTANKAEIEDLKVNKLDAETADITFATIESLKATNAEINNLKVNHGDFANATIENLQAQNAKIENLEAKKLNVEDAEIKYANIDFANIGMAAVEKLFAQSGIIKDLVVGDQHITGELVGVTIKGDIIEGNTIVADKLVVKGSDGLYYKLNTDGMKVEAEQTEYNSLNGSVITAKSITATKISVQDLVAFDATIGGFKITDKSIYSGTKESADNSTRGIYLDSIGQISVGDSNNYLKFFKDTDGKWKLAISANSIKLSASNTTIEDALDDMKDKVNNTTKSVEEHFASSTDPTQVPTTGWSTTPPIWQNGKYIWSKIVTTYVDGRISESKPVCITGAKGEAGTSGSSGKGIKTITNYYLATNANSGVTDTTAGWTETVQTITSSKKYLWNYEKITYTDNSTTKTTPVIIGAYGDKGQNGSNGTDGQAGADGVGIRSITEKYAVSSSNSTPPTTWHDTVQTMTATNRYLWNYEIITLTDGTTSQTDKRVIGVYGDKGNTGATGPSGKGIKTVTNYYLATTVNTGVTHSTSGWTTTIQSLTSTNKYLWNYELITYTDNSTTKTNPLVIGVYGDKGQNGAAGATGNGIKSIAEKYAVSTSNSTAPTTWYDSVQVMTATNRYLWNYEIITYTNGSTSETAKRVIGVYGDKGNTGSTGPAGKGVKTITNYYLATNSSSGVTDATAGWTTTVQSISSSKKYLWNYEVITYTDNSTTKTLPAIIGAYGDKGQNGTNGATGAAGNGIKTITEYYLVSANKTGVTTSTSGWSTTIPTMTATNKYLWNYEVIAYTNGTNSTGTPKVIGVYGDKGNTGATGATGPTGPAGNGIKSVDVEYYLSTSSTTQTGGSWSTTAPAWVNGKYMWSRTKTVTTDGATKYSSPACITGQKGATGSTGATGGTGPTGATGQGVQSITEEYYLSTSKTSQSGGSWVTTPPTWSVGKYMWTRSKIVYKNPTATAYTTPVCDSSWEAVNEIEFGGRNLIIGSAHGGSDYAAGSGSIKSDGIFGKDAVHTTGAWTGFYIKIKQIASRNKLKVGDTVTISIYVSTNSSVSVTSNITLYRHDGSDVAGKRFGDIKLISGSWHRLVYTYKITSNALVDTVRFEANATTTHEILWSCPQLELGNKVSDWSPAPEDIEQRVSNTELELKPDKILQKVNTQIGAGGKIDTVSTVLDKTGFTVKNGAIKIQNKAGTIVLQGDTNGNLLLNNITANNATITGTVTVSSHQHQIFRVDTADTKYPHMVIDSYGPYMDRLSVCTDYLGYVNQKAVDGVFIRNNKMEITGFAEVLFIRGDTRATGKLTVNNIQCTNGGIMLPSYQALSWDTPGDGSRIYTECSNNVTTLCLETSDDGDQDTVRIRNKHWQNGTKDVVIFKRDYVNVNAQMIANAKISVDSNYPYIDFRSASGSRGGYVGFGNGPSNYLYITCDTSKYVSVAAHLVPTQTVAFWVGTNSPNQKWKGMCAEGGVVGSSDIRIKENVTRLDGTLVSYDEVHDEILEFDLFNLSPKTNKRAISTDYYEFMKDRFVPSYYNYKYDPLLTSDGDFTIDPEVEMDMLKNVGFIAQDYDLENDLVAKEFIIKHPETGELSYNHMSYVTVGMIALQEALKKIDSLEKEIQNLKNK